MTELKKAIDAVLDGVTAATPGVPGVAAAVTDRVGTIYEGARGVRNTSPGERFTPDTVCAIFSTTKAIAGTACLQLVEQGLLDLDAPAKAYAPQLGEIMVVDGFGSDGKPKLRPPKRDVTTRHLLTHTAGFSDDFVNETWTRFTNGRGTSVSVNGLLAMEAATYQHAKHRGH